MENDKKAICRDRFEADRYFIKDPEELRARYAIYYEAMPIDGSSIFYESMSGARMMDNPYAIFKAIYEDPRFSDRTHVWSMGAYETIPDRYRGTPNIRFVTRHTDAYLRLLASAKHIICNSVLPDYFVRKPGQLYLNTWHGIAYKQIGRSDLAPLGGAGGVYNMLQATHILTPCEFMTKLQLHGMSMNGVYSGELAEIGYPRIDRTINLSAAEKSRIAAGLGLSDDKRTVLYAPTWRGTSADGRFDVERLEQDLELLASLDANVIFMGHHIMLKHVRNLDYGSIIVPPSSTNTNELLAIVDILVTDYSSIFFDFLVTGRPVIHYMYDYDDYVKERGVNLEIADLPGEIAFTSEDMVGEVRRHLEEAWKPTEAYRRALSRFCPHEDGAASKRAADWFFSGKRDGIGIVPKSAKKSVAFWGGRLGGAKEAGEFFAKLRKYVNSGEWDVVLVVARAIQKNAELMNLIRNLPQAVTIIARNSHGTVATPEELAAVNEVDVGGARKPAAIALHRRAYMREYRRILGDAVFDEQVEFEGNSRFWKELAACSRFHGHLTP